MRISDWSSDVCSSDLRAHGNPRDLVEAAEFYGKAVEMDESLPEAQRGLGLALIKTGRRTEGQSALRRYLELKPHASDASMISMLASRSEEHTSELQSLMRL